MMQIVFKIKGIYTVRYMEDSCSVNIYTLLVFSPKGIDLIGKILRRENMEAIVMSTRYEDNVNFGLLLTIKNNSNITVGDNLTFIVHENN